MSESKTVRVKRETWRELHEQKQPGETMDDVISGLIDENAAELSPE